MKIILLDPYFYPCMGGIEKVVYNHAEALAHHGHDVHVVTSYLKYPRGIYSDLPDQEILQPGFTIHRLQVLLRMPFPGFVYPSRGGVIIPQLKQTIAALKPDVIHAHNIGAPAWAYVGVSYALNQTQKAKPVNFYYSPHLHPSRLTKSAFEFLNPFLPQKLFYHYLNARPLRQAKRIFVLTPVEQEYLLREFKAATSTPISCLPNGTTPPALFHQRLSIALTNVNILFVGRVDDPRKGFAELLVAMRQIWKQLDHYSITLRVVGSISEKTQTHCKAEFGDRIVIRGVLSELELEAEYALADLFVMPSQYEAFGIPFLEAMRYGVPVLGTQVGGVPYVVPPETGILIPPGNSTALIQALSQLIPNHQKRHELGQKGRAWVKQFYWSNIIKQLESFYLEDLSV